MKPASRIDSGDRLAATLVFSVILNGILLLGIGFTISDPAPLLHTLDVILVQTHSDEAPEKADFLAQASQQGGGESELAERPSEMQPAPAPNPAPGIAPMPMEAGAPRPQPQQHEAVVTREAPSPDKADTRQSVQTPDRPLPPSREVVERNLEMARLAAEVERRQQEYAKRPKRKFLSANTREYEYAAYLKSWQERVERVGNLNYPQQAREQNLTGKLVMTVAVHRNGRVEKDGITIVQSSGSKILDDAAIHTVRMSEPFAPLPDTGDGTDILHITRTWHYLPGDKMINR